MNFKEIKKYDIANGPGCRTTIWVTGCSIKCPGCFNSEIQDPNTGNLFTDETLEFIIKSLEPEYINGFTFLGVDPLHPNNADECARIAKAIKEKYGKDKDVWLWTGYSFENVKDKEVFKYVDICVDGPFLAEKYDISLKYAGSSNQRVIDVQRSLAEGRTIESEIYKNK